MKHALIIALTSLSLVAHGQYRFTHLDINDGLSQNSITDLFQDSQGFVWVATQDGLNRYDGHSFVQYTTNGQPPLADNFLWDITEDSFGNIWVASRQGAMRLNWRASKLTHFYGEKGNSSLGALNQIAAINQSKTKMLLSNSMGQVYALDPTILADSSSVLLTHQFERNKVVAFSEVLYRSVEYQGQVFEFTLNQLRFGQSRIPFPEGHILTTETKSVIVQSKGLYVGTNRGLLLFDFLSNSFSEITCIGIRVTDLLLVDDVIWVGTDQGIALLNTITNDCTEWIKPDSSEESLSVGAVTSLLQTKEGIIWVGTSNGGINLYDPRKEQFKFLKKEHGIGRPPVWSIYVDGNITWLGTEDGLYKLVMNGLPTAKTFVRDAIKSIEKIALPPLQNTRITAIEKIAPSLLLIGTADGTLLKLNTTSLHATKISMDLGDRSGLRNAISSIRKYQSDIWVASHLGLFQFDSNLQFIGRVGFEKFKMSETIFDYFLSAYIDKKGSLWLGANNGCYVRDTNGTVQFYPYDESKPETGPAFKFISGFFEDYQERLWIATYGGGVSCLEYSTGKFFHLNTSNGLPNNVCSSITGNEQSIWVSTNSGLSRIDPTTLEIINFTKEDGLIGNEFAINAVAKTPQGEFLFGGIDGLVAFDPSRLVLFPKPPAPVISKILVNYKEANIPSSGILRLTPDDRSLSVQFTSLDYRFNTNFQYEYMLEGFERKWVRVESNNRMATYTPPTGDYKLRIRTIHGDLIGRETVLLLTVIPPFYQTVWFLILCAISSLVIIVVVVRYFSHQRLKSRLQELETQQKIQKERERISRDLHDNVGSQITYIASSLDNMPDTPKTAELGEFARQTMDQLRESIWAINHDTISSDELQLRIVGLLSKMMGNQERIEYRVNVENLSKSINPTTAINLFRIIQEAVNNTLKHANATEIDVQLTFSDYPTLIIKDNGKGFDGNRIDGHFGLANLQNRASEIGGLFLLETTPGKGTTITVSKFKIG